MPRKLSRVGVSAFLQLGHVPPPCTVIQGVTPLEPGHVGIWQDGNWQTTAYWTLPLSDGSAQQNPATIADELREILLESSKSQLMADVPIALFLSGGVDSGAIVALASRARARKDAPLTTLTVTSKSFRKTDRLLIRSSAQVGLAVPRTHRAAMARRVRRRDLAKHVCIRRPGHYSRGPEGPFHEVRARNRS